MAKNFMESTVVRETYNFFYVLTGEPITKHIPITYYTESGYEGTDDGGTGVVIEWSRSKTGWEPERVTKSKVDLEAC